MSGAKGPPLGAGGVASGASGARRRRTRCRRCQACLRTECGECHFCKDMKKFGGPGRMKQSCLLRQCTAPVLPHTAVCLACGEAGKEDTVDDPDDKFSLCLMECTICNEIIHPSCLKMGKAEGIINDEIPNCWECPKCHKEGKTSKDQTDGSGKRRLDNGEVGRWKITDEPPPKKKALPAGDEVSRSDSRGGEGRAEGRAEGRSNESRAEGRSNEGHKRKKDKEPAPDAKKKIKGNHEKRLKKKPKPEENGSGSGGGAQGSGAGASSVGTSGSGSSNQDQRSHQREKLERFKRMCLLERRLSSSSSSSSSESDSSDSDSDSANHRAGSPPSSPFSPAHRERKYSERERERERDRRLAELGFSASDESDDPTRAEDPEEREEPKRRGEGLTLKRKTMETDEDEEERRDRKSSLPSPLSSNQMSASGPHDVFVPKQRNNGADSRNGRRNNVVGGEKENASTNHRHGTAPGAGAKTGARSRSKLRSKPSGSGARLGSAPSLPSSNGSSAVSLPLPRCRPPAPPCPPRPPRPLERHLVKPPPHCPEPSLLPLTTGHAHILHRDTWVRVFAHLSHRELCVCMRVCRTWSRWCCDKRLWSHIDLSRQRSITAPMLSGIIRRQPVSLNLGSTNISKKQLMWLLNRLQGLEQLFLPGCLWSSVSALCLTVCPGLRLLDLSRVEELKDSQLKELLAPPTELRSAHGDCRGGRFQGVTELRLAGLEVTDAATRLLLRYTPHLQRLDLSHCPLLSDQGIATLTSGLCPLRLGHLGLAGCVRLSEQAVALLRRCSSLQTVDLRSCMQLSAETAQLLHFPSSSAACTASAPPTSCPLLKNS
ncbi:unnamed protein product [Knipowitschia caucasica]